MSKTNIDDEILMAFSKNSLQKVSELNGITNVMLREGPKPEFFDAIHRATTAIKSFALTCQQNDIVNFISAKIEPEYDNLRLNKQKINDEFKNSIKEKITELKGLITQVVKSDNKGNTNTVEPIEIENNASHTLFTAIGQLSVWSFHELMNALAKVHGYTEFLEDIAELMNSDTEQAKKDLKGIQEKLTTNVNHMSGIINRIRSLRGKTKIVIKEHNIRSVIKNIQDMTQQPPKTLNWSSLHIPSVDVKFDQIIFEQIWVHLWKLLEEWRTAGTTTLSVCYGHYEKNNKAVDENFKNLLSLYIWLEPNNKDKIDPLSIKYFKETPRPDLAYVFHYTSKIAERISANITSGKTDNGIIVFCITIPCGEIHVAQSETGNSIPQPLHILKMKDNDKPLKNILIIDDEKDLRTILSLKISKMGYGVFTAENIEQANSIINNKKIHLIISDLFLNNESGLDLLKNLNSTSSKIPFMFISGANEDDIPRSLLDILSKYSKAFLTKPIPTNVLKETLEKILPLD
ncbi:response regulator [Spirobacillus cienkowskii]|uniref:response regulator n=1 Tax=Spirobacillus cienkowskii TaxID=495820 RepID=UPI0030CDF6F2